MAVEWNLIGMNFFFYFEGMYLQIKDILQQMMVMLKSKELKICGLLKKCIFKGI